MTEDSQLIQVGAARVRMFNVAYMQFRPEQFMPVPEGEAELFARPMITSINCVHVALRGMSLLVDASAELVAPDALEAPLDLQQPSSLLDQMVAAKIQPSQITHVVVTHPHHDHISGLTAASDGRIEPNFPNARHYLGRADWEDGNMQKALQDVGSVENRTLGELNRLGLLELIEGDHELDVGVRIIASPGETPGHQMLRIHSQGQTLYCTGDLFHFPFEFEHPEWMAHWQDQKATLASRHMLVDAALAEKAILVVTHMPDFGRVQSAVKGVVWNEI